MVKFNILDQTPYMAQNTISPLSDSITLAQEAEKMGYSGI
jgi:hypothetical protein